MVSKRSSRYSCRGACRPEPGPGLGLGSLAAGGKLSRATIAALRREGLVRVGRDGFRPRLAPAETGDDPTSPITQTLFLSPLPLRHRPAPITTPTAHMTPPPALPSTSSGTAPASGPPRTLPRSVFLIGAQATGKTELFEAVRREFAGSPAVEEVARKVMSERGWTGADTGREGRQEVLFWETVREENIAAGPLGAREVTTSTENLVSQISQPVLRQYPH